MGKRFERFGDVAERLERPSPGDGVEPEAFFAYGSAMPGARQRFLQRVEKLEIRRAAMSPAASGGRIVEPVAKEDC